MAGMIPVIQLYRRLRLEGYPPTAVSMAVISGSYIALDTRDVVVTLCDAANRRCLAG